MHVHAQTIKHVVDAAAVATGLGTWWAQGPLLAAWASFFYILVRAGASVYLWWQKRRGGCPSCGGEHNP